MAWAVLLQLFSVAAPYRESAGRFGFAPKGLAKVVLNALSPISSPPRFLGGQAAAGMTAA
jgi:hypothetical protein